jgi:Ca2+-transporting ATPase
LTAVLLLWTNLVEDSFPNIALSFEPGEEGVMKKPPVKKSEPVLDKESKIIVFAIGLITDFVLLGIFLYFYYAETLSIIHLQTLIFAGLGLDTFFYIYSIKNLRASIFSYNIFNNKYLVWATVIGVGMMLAAIYIPSLNNLLETEPLRLSDWAIIISLGLVKLMGVELVKWWFIHRDFDGDGQKDFQSKKSLTEPKAA